MREKVDYFCMNFVLRFVLLVMVCVLDYHLVHSLKAVITKKTVASSSKCTICQYQWLSLISPQCKYDSLNFYHIHKMVSEASF